MSLEASTPRSRGHRWKRNWQRVKLNEAPHRPGCYALFRGKVLMYIGSAFNIRVRLQHQLIGTRHTYAHTRFGPTAELQLRIAVNKRRNEHATRELRLIERLRPPMNKAGTREHAG